MTALHIMPQNRPSDIAKTGRRRVQQYRRHSNSSLLHWDDLPDWQRDNEYIRSGYRPISFSFRQSLHSILYVHNETVNIHSHLVGAVLFFSLPFATFYLPSSRYSIARTSDVIVFATFFFGVATCFLLSSTFHIIANHSPDMNVVGNQLDYLGIVVLMWGSTIPSVYYGFHCDPDLQRPYWATVSLLAGACVITTFNSRFRHPNLRPYRALMYAGLGFSALGFVFHGLLLYGWEVQDLRMSLRWMCLMAAFNLVGATAYATRIPERFCPYKFDIWGNSHQILHFMVILAGLAHMYGLLSAFDNLHSQKVPCFSNSVSKAFA